MRSLLLATAGHVNHGKSTLIERLTGFNPDRLPQEKSRGMTLDLGFGHAEGLSFVDCPGHESLTRHTIAGQNGVDGALLIVAMNEGVREQTREHSRLLTWIGVTAILIVITKSDLAESDETRERQIRKIKGDVRALFGATARLDFFVTCKRDDVTPLRAKIFDFFKPTAKMRSLAVNRFAVDRSFTLKGIGTIVTGTLTEGPICKGDRATVWFSNNKKPCEVVIRALHQAGSQREHASEPGRFALLLDGVHPEELIRGSQLIFGQIPNLSEHFALNLEWAVPVKKQFTAILQWATMSIEARLTLHPKGFWRVRTPFPIPLRRHDRVIIRSPHRVTSFGQVIGGGVVIDGQLPLGRVTTVPSQDDREFVAQMRGVEKDSKSVSWRAGLELSEAQALIAEELGARAKAEKSSAPATLTSLKPGELTPAQRVVLEFLKKERWTAFIAKKDLDAAHRLAKENLVHHIRDGHFLHHDHYDELIAWLNDYFAKNTDLTIDGARDFFQTGRKTFLEILEFCDRHQFTFRKDNVRKKFKLPPCSRREVSLQ